jgi:hypothetical protein
MFSQECLNAVSQAMSQSGRYQLNIHPTILKAASTSSSSFGGQLPWPEIEALCRANQADIVIAAEYFDGEFTVIPLPPPPPPAVAPPGLTVRGTTAAKVGFRIYDPVQKAITYQNNYVRSLSWTQSGVSILEATSKLLKGPDALHEVAQAAGRAFGRQFISLSVWEPRLMFKGKKSPQMQKAARLALTNNWQQATDAWIAAYNTATTPKDKGRAAYNVALGYEVQGQLATAKEWVSMSYVENGDKRALRYGYAIDERIHEAQVLQQQNK